jgi:hypothetical protein
MLREAEDDGLHHRKEKGISALLVPDRRDRTVS